jgi:hypothetical protein
MTKRNREGDDDAIGEKNVKKWNKYLLMKKM